MSQNRAFRPLAPISGNISKQPVPIKNNQEFLHVIQSMENRVTQYGESDTDSNDPQVLDLHPSDDSYDLHILEQMRLHQEALATGKKRKIAFSRANGPLRKPIVNQILSPPLSAVNIEAFGNNFFDPTSLERLVDLEERASTPSSSSSIRNSRRLSGFRTKQPRGEWYEKAKKGLSTERAPVVQESDTIEFRASLHGVDDSPLSYKSSNKGTPAATQPSKPSRPSLLDTSFFSADSLLESTPAFPQQKKYIGIQEAKFDEQQALKSFKPTLSPPRERIRTTVEDFPLSRPVTVPEQNSNERKIPVSQAEREDTRNLLRLLARSTSSTPSPVPARNKASSTKPPAEANLTSTAKPVKNPGTQRYPKENIPSQTPGMDSLGRMNASNFETPLNLRTPKPMGAWVDTPKSTNLPLTGGNKKMIDMSEAQVKREVKSEHSKQQDEKSALGKASQPDKPKSALASILNFARSSKEDMGDATINSLQDLMDNSDRENEEASTFQKRLKSRSNLVGHNDQELREILEHKIASELPYSDREPASPKELAMIRDIVDKRMARSGHRAQPNEAKKEQPLTPRKKERLQEEIQLQKMTDRVNSLSFYTASMRAGLKRLERNLNPAKGCNHCDCPGNCFGAHPFTAMIRAIIRSFVTSIDGAYSLTWVGLLCSIFFVWLLVESALCSTTCRPVYSYWNPQPFGPFEGIEPPYILFTWITEPFSITPHGIYGILKEFSNIFNSNPKVQLASTETFTSQFVATMTTNLREATDWGVGGVEDFF